MQSATCGRHTAISHPSHVFTTNCGGVNSPHTRHCAVCVRVCVRESRSTYATINKHDERRMRSVRKKVAWSKRNHSDLTGFSAHRNQHDFSSSFSLNFPVNHVKGHFVNGHAHCYRKMRCLCKSEMKFGENVQLYSVHRTTLYGSGFWSRFRCSL